MIDVEIEQLHPLAQAAAFPEFRRGNRKPHRSTMFRWALCGIGGIRLETVRVGGSMCTSREAARRFIKALTAVQQADQPTATPRSPAATKRACTAAERDLDEAGI